MKDSLNYRLRSLMLPGLKRWIVVILFGIASIVLGVFLLLGYHPITVTGQFIRDLMEHAADVLPYRMSGVIVIVSGALIICVSIAKIIVSVLVPICPVIGNQFLMFSIVSAISVGALKLLP